MPLAASADGWRGRIGESFTAQAAARLADAALQVLRETFATRVLVSHDGRAAGPEAAELILAVAARHSCEAIYLARHIPTPIATSLLSQGTVDIAFVITASHNPSDWNGVKIKAGRLGSVSGALERQIDERFRGMHDEPITGVQVDARAEARYRTLQVSELVDQHCDQLMQRIGPLSWSGMRIVIDGLGGVAGKPIAQLCRRLGAEVTGVGDLVLETFGGVKPDPIIAESQQRCRGAVLASNADLGIVLDGDGDRIVLIGHDGDIWQSQELLAALLQRMQGNARAQTDGPILVTAATGLLVRRFALAQGREVIETAIGFKHIVGKMNARERSVGIGAVGDFGFQAYGSDRDPFAMLLLLAAAFPQLRKITEAIAGLRAAYATEHLQWTERHWHAHGDHTLVRANAALLERIVALDGRETGCADGRKFQFDQDQWLMVRSSTTEGGIRIYGEVADPAVVEDLLAQAQHALDADPTPYPDDLADPLPT